MKEFMNLDITEIDRCCKKVCEDIYEEIKARKESIFLDTAKRFYPSTQYSIEALEDLRNRLGEEGICKCAPDKKVPITETETEISSRKNLERKRYPATISAGLTRFARSGRPILPSPASDGCCIHVCRALNDQIKSVDNILDASVMQRASIEMNVLEIEAIKKESMGRLPMKKEEMEKRAIRKAEWEMAQNKKFISLAYQSYTLKEYRTYMKKNNVCKCEL
jgi:hypothetical protein